MLEGDEWKNSDKPLATPQDMHKFHQLGTRLLVDCPQFNRIADVRVAELSPDGEYVQLVASTRGLFAIMDGVWVRTRDIQVLSVFPNDLLAQRKAVQEIAIQEKGNGWREYNDNEPDDIG